MPRAGWLAVGGAVAALIGSSLSGGPAAGLAVAAGAVTVAAIAAARGRVRFAATVIGGALVLARLAMATLVDGPAAAPPPPHGEQVWHGEVVSVGSTAGGVQRSLLVIAGASGEAWRTYAWLPRYPPLAPSDLVRFSAELEPLPPPGTGQFEQGFRDYLERDGIVATVRVREFETLPAGGPLGTLERMRRTGGTLLSRSLPSPESGLAAGILIGLRDQVDRGVAEDFTTAGLSHVVAISGWNIALVGGIVAAMLRRRPRRQRALVVLGAIVLYALLAGASPSVVRAAIMAGVCLLARESGRSGGAATALGLAAWAMLLVDPGIVSDVGYQLSVAATAGLLAWSRQWSEGMRHRIPAWVPTWLIESLAVSLTAQAATLPLVLYHFGRLSLVAPLANLVIAPIVAPVMFASLLGLGAGVLLAAGVPGLLVAPLALAASLLLGTMIGVADVAASVPFASIDLPPPADAVGAIVAVGFVAAIATERGRAVTRRLLGTIRLTRRRRSPSAARAPRLADARVASASHAPDRSPSHAADPSSDHILVRRMVAAVCAAGVCLLVVAGSLATGRADGRLRLTVLDVGQGDAVLVEGDRGARMLVDGGPDPDRLAVLLDERIPAWDRRIDLVVLSHPHEDHVAGLPMLLERYRVSTVAEPGMLGPGPGDRAFRERLGDGSHRRIVLAAGDPFRLDGASVTVLWPRRGEVPITPADTGTGINNVSIVLDIRFGQRRLVLSGDVEEEVDPQLIAGGLALGGPVDVLKVAHHGSKTASTDAFLDAATPRLALVSAGLGNRYGHPAPSTVARLEARGARVLRTDLDGTIEVSTDGQDVRLSTTGGRSAGAPTTLGGTVAAGAAFAADRSTTVAGSFCALPRPVPALDRTAAPGIRRKPRGTDVDHGGVRLRSRLADARARGEAPPSVAAPAGWERPCYDRRDAHPLATRGRGGARRVPPVGPIRGSLRRGRRDRHVPREAHRGTGHRGRSAAGGSRGPPPRRRQAAPREPSAEAAGPWRCRG